MADAPAARARLPRLCRRRKRCAGCTLKQELSLEAVGAQLGVSSSVARRRLIAAGVARRPSFQTRYPRRDFSGKLAERAYLLGFRLGDLHVALTELSVVVKCTSTRAEQVDLFEALFGPYGHVYTSTGTPDSERSLKAAVRMQVGLNRTFEFLVPKEDRVPEWVLAGDEAFYAYFAGYLDAEGYVKTCLPRGYRHRAGAGGDPLLRPQRLHATRCGPQRTRNSLSPGRTSCACRLHQQARRAQQRRDLGRWGSVKAVSLCRLFERIDPYVRHARRRRDMETGLGRSQARLALPAR